MSASDTSCSSCGAKEVLWQRQRCGRGIERRPRLLRHLLPRLR